MIAFIVAFSSIIATLYRFEVNHTLLKISLVLYAVIPVFPLYSLLIGGDSFFSVFFLYYMLEILWIFGTKGAVLKNNKFILAMILEIFLMSASKNQGVYVCSWQCSCFASFTLVNIPGKIRYAWLYQLFFSSLDIVEHFLKWRRLPV